MNLSFFIALGLLAPFLLFFYYLKPEDKRIHILGFFVIIFGWVFSDISAIEFTRTLGFLPFQFSRSITDFDWNSVGEIFTIIYNFPTLDFPRKIFILFVLVTAEVYVNYIFLVFAIKITPTIVTEEAKMLRKVRKATYFSFISLTMATKMSLMLLGIVIWAYAHLVSSLPIFISLIVGGIFSSYVLVKTRNIYLLFIAQFLWDFYILVL